VRFYWFIGRHMDLDCVTLFIAMLWHARLAALIWCWMTRDVRIGIALVVWHEWLTSMLAHSAISCSIAIVHVGSEVAIR